MTRYRDSIVKVVAWLSVILAVGSLAWALGVHQGYCHRSASKNYLVVGFWILAPPIWFFLEWFYLCEGLPKDQLEWISHTHDLARNIWLALVAVLTVLLEIQGLGHEG